MPDIAKKPSLLILLILALLTKGAISMGQGDWQASSHPVALSRIPTHIGGWSSVDLPLDSNSRQMLMPDAYLLRRYIGKHERPVEFLVIYGHAKRTFHSPGSCLPGSGWLVVSKRPIMLDYGNQKLSMMLFHIQKERERQLVLFTFLAGNAHTSSLYRHNWNLLMDRILHRANGGALVRIMIPMPDGEKPALECARRFARTAFPPLRAELAAKRTR